MGCIWVGVPQKALRGKGLGARPGAQGWRSSRSPRPPWKHHEPEAQQTFHPSGPRLARSERPAEWPRPGRRRSAGPRRRPPATPPRSCERGWKPRWEVGSARSGSGAGGAEGGPTAIGAQPSAASQWMARAPRGRGGSRVLGSVTRRRRAAVLGTTRVPGGFRRPSQVSALAEGPRLEPGPGCPGRRPAGRPTRAAAVPGRGSGGGGTG